MSQMMKWAEAELDFAGYTDGDEIEGLMRNGVLGLLKVFTDQGHSGSSAPHMVALFERLAMWKPLTPLTGAEDEWNEVGEGVYQNRRASTIFKGEDGEAYNIEGIVFWEWYTDEETGERTKCYFTSRDSRTPVTFPYTVPDKPEYREATTPTKG